MPSARPVVRSVEGLELAGGAIQSYASGNAPFSVTVSLAALDSEVAKVVSPAAMSEAAVLAAADFEACGRLSVGDEVFVRSSSIPSCRYERKQHEQPIVRGESGVRNDR
jgi:hypothetical protein